MGWIVIGAVWCLLALSSPASADRDYFVKMRMPTSRYDGDLVTVVPQDGLYLISARTDPEATSRLRVTINNNVLYFIQGTIRASQALAVRLGANDSVRANYPNRQCPRSTSRVSYTYLMIARVSDVNVADYLTISVVGNNNRDLSRHSVFHLGSWMPSPNSLYPMRLSSDGIYWVTLRGVGTADGTSERLSLQVKYTGNLLMTAWLDVGHSASASVAGAFHFHEGSTLELSYHKDGPLSNETIFSFVYLAGNTPACTGMGHPIAMTAYIEDEPSARCARRPIPWISDSQYFNIMRWASATTNEGGIFTRRTSEQRSFVLIPKTGTYLVSLVADNPKNEQVTLSLRRRRGRHDDQIWSTEADLVPTGDTYVDAFIEGDELYVVKKGSCRSKRAGGATMWSVALVQRPHCHG